MLSNRADGIPLAASERRSGISTFGIWEETKVDSGVSSHGAMKQVGDQGVAIIGVSRRSTGIEDG